MNGFWSIAAGGAGRARLPGADCAGADRRISGGPLPYVWKPQCTQMK
jgi:hypothetical protein